MRGINLTKPVVLVGMMGSGKSTIGKRLAQKLNLQFYDSDKIIEEREGLSVVDIYDFRGQEYFKNKEEQVITEVLSYGTVILSTGGESFLNDNIRNKIKDNAVSIWLKTDLKILQDRVSRRNTRPQFISSDSKELLENMITNSEPVFNEADIIVESTDLDAYMLVDLVLNRIKNFLHG
jgi:shikimate kinase